MRVVLAEGGLADQLGRILDDERGSVALANTMADLTAADRPLGKALAPRGRRRGVNTLESGSLDRVGG